MAKIRTIDAFIDGKCFGKVSTKQGVLDLLEQIKNEDWEAENKIDKDYWNDFEKNILNSTYYISYYKKQHALKAMCGEFFEKIYNSGPRSPYVFEV